MDSHYFQVMKAREQVTEDTEKYYFAYSTALDLQAFMEWRNQHSYEFFNLPEGILAEGIDLDLTFDFPSRWWGGLAAGLVDKPGVKIYGKLFKIKAKDWPVIQHKEGFVTGMCVEKNIRVKIGGDVIEAIAFTTNPARANTQGEISPRFLQALVRGAEQSQLPEEYISKLKSY